VLNFQVSRADVTFDAKFPQPDFEMLADDASFLEKIFRFLQPHGLRTADVRFDPGDGSIGDEQIVCQLPSYWITVRVRVDRIEIVSTTLLREQTQALKGVVASALGAVVEHRAGIPFASFGMALNLHGAIEGIAAQSYLARYMANPPKGLGPQVGNGMAAYFGQHDDRLFASVTADLSAVVPNAVFVKVQAQWDSRKVGPASIVDVSERFVQAGLASLDLQLPVVNRAQ